MFNSRKEKISIAMVASNLELNGISSVIMNYIQYINLDKIDITLIVGKKVNPKYRKLCRERGVKIITLKNKRRNTKKFYFGLLKNFLTHQFDIVHVHGSSATIGLELFLAKISGIKVRIAHSHNTTSPNLKLHKLMKPLLKFSYTEGFACSKEAGKWLFDDQPFTVIPNGIEVNNFKFNNSVRETTRTKLKLGDSYVVGHIGRFNYQKNHEFIIKVFEEILKKRPNSRLLLVGNGPDYDKFKAQLAKKSYINKIILYGETNDTSGLYMAMDAFLFPSRFEGLPVTLIEGQISGLPCLVSDVITEDVRLSKNLQFCSLKKSSTYWADKLLNLKPLKRNSFFYNHLKAIDHYYIKNDVKLLENKYKEIIKYGKF